MVYYLVSGLRVAAVRAVAYMTLVHIGISVSDSEICQNDLVNMTRWLI